MLHMTNIGAVLQMANEALVVRRYMAISEILLYGFGT